MARKWCSGRKARCTQLNKSIVELKLTDHLPGQGWYHVSESCEVYDVVVHLLWEAAILKV